MSTNFEFQHASARDRYSYRDPYRWLASTKLIVRTQAIDTWMVFATVLASLAVAWVHAHNASIWYDEAITLLPLLPLVRVHLFARPQQYPIFGGFPTELWALLKGSMEGAMPSTWLPHWGFALWVGAYFAGLGCWRCRKRHDFLLPFIYLTFLTGFFVLAILTNKSIAKMPADYYLGLAVPLVALLIGFGVNAAPRASSLLAALVVGTATPVSMTKSIDYRTMVQKIRSECPECPILVGAGYAGAIPACVLYEARGANVFLLKPQDTVGEALERMGDPADLVLVPANEPATRKLEQEFVRDFPSVERRGYFEIDASRAERKSERGLLAEREKVVRPFASGWGF